MSTSLKSSSHRTIYLIGSLRNERIPEYGEAIRALGHDCFDDWFAAGPEADDKWRDYEVSRGHDYYTALHGHAAANVFAFDTKHMARCDTVILAMPAGKSGHLEFGYCIGKGKQGFILFDEVPERYDVMYRFAIESGGDVCFCLPHLLELLK